MRALTLTRRLTRAHDVPLSSGVTVPLLPYAWSTCTGDCELRCARCVLRSGPLPTSIVLVDIHLFWFAADCGFFLPLRAVLAEHLPPPSTPPPPPPSPPRRSAERAARMPYVPPHRRQQAATGDAAVTSESSKSLQDLLQAPSRPPQEPRFREQGARGGAASSGSRARGPATYLSDLPHGVPLLGGSNEFCDSFFHVRATPEAGLQLRCLRRQGMR